MAADEDGLTVAQLSATTGVPAHTLRCEERAGLIRPVVAGRGLIAIPRPKGDSVVYVCNESLRVSRIDESA